MDKKIMEDGENNIEHDPISHEAITTINGSSVLSDEELDIIFDRLLQDIKP